MSYICQECNEVQTGSPNKVVTETRDKEYEEKEYYFRGRKKKEKGGSGWEIVKELNLCDDCAKRHAK